MYKSIKALGLVMLTAVTMNIAAPKDSHALLILTLGNPRVVVTPLGVVLCIISLPFCVLGGDGAPTVTAEGLKNNGYSESEITTILSDDAMVSRLMAQKGAEFSISAQDSRESVSAEIRGLYPQVSDLYVDVVAQAAGLSH